MPEITSTIKTIIWDLDGTLLDSFGIYRDCINKVMRIRGRPEVPEDILRYNHHGTIEESIANILKEVGYDTSEADFVRDFYVIDNAVIKDVDHHLFEDAVTLAERAHTAGKRQIVITNRAHGTDRGNGSPRNLVANSQSLSKVIDEVVCGDDSAYRKPYREVLEARFGTSLAELGGIMVIGDQYVDAAFARNIGCDAILVTRAEKIVHLDRLVDWEKHVKIVSSLHEVKIQSGQ